MVKEYILKIKFLRNLKENKFVIKCIFFKDNFSYIDIDIMFVG